MQNDPYFCGLRTIIDTIGIMLIFILLMCETFLTNSGDFYRAVFKTHIYTECNRNASVRNINKS